MGFGLSVREGEGPLMGVQVDLHCGDCLTILPTLSAGPVHAVVTSPPYAEQRAKQYGGIREEDYPDWTVSWMRAVRRLLREDGSVLIVIREHVKNGQISDYVHRTRLALRGDGWLEPDELIWIKPDGMPVGRVDRPRRSWERVLWFSRSPDCCCYPKAKGQPSDRVGCFSTRNNASWIHGDHGNPVIKLGISRVPDWVSLSPRLNPDGTWKHPATFPPQLPAWLMALVTLEGATVLDPFMGSGTTGFLGIEQNPGYFDIASQRIAAAQADAASCLTFAD
jgi:site-specific DNA-methyltransferase (adenine-specific)